MVIISLYLPNWVSEMPPGFVFTGYVCEGPICFKLVCIFIEREAQKIWTQASMIMYLTLMVIPILYFFAKFMSPYLPGWCTQLWCLKLSCHAFFWEPCISSFSGFCLLLVFFPVSYLRSFCDFVLRLPVGQLAQGMVILFQN